MEAKDTVMEGNQIAACYRIKANTTPGILWEDARKAVDVEIATRQDEISFKAGIKRVVEDISMEIDNAPLNKRLSTLEIVLDKWRTKIKEERE